MIKSCLREKIIDWYTQGVAVKSIQKMLEIKGVYISYKEINEMIDEYVESL